MIVGLPRTLQRRWRATGPVPVERLGSNRGRLPGHGARIRRATQARAKGWLVNDTVFAAAIYCALGRFVKQITCEDQAASPAADAWLRLRSISGAVEFRCRGQWNEAQRTQESALMDFRESLSAQRRAPHSSPRMMRSIASSKSDSRRCVAGEGAAG